MLSVRNGVIAVEFYLAAFGARVLFRVDDERGEVVAEMAVGGSRFWLADESPVNLNFSPESLGGGSVRMIMIVDDPDAAFERAIKAGQPSSGRSRIKSTAGALVESLTPSGIVRKLESHCPLRRETR